MGFTPLGCAGPMRHCRAGSWTDIGLVGCSVGAWPDEVTPVRSLAAHRRILEAIRRCDGPAARQAMRRHVKMVADVGLLRWSAVERGQGDAGNPG